MPNNKLYLLLPLICTLVFVAAANAQTPQQGGSIIHDVYDIDSTEVNEKRRILVHVPIGYERTTKKYPVIYMLDGHSPQPGMMGGILGQQAWGGHVPEMILVSIQNTNRSRDLTPTDDGKGGTVGGGDKFLDFIEKEIIPLVEKNYRVQPYRIFAGHSLGGLTVVYSMTSRPDLFNAYIAASPVLHYDKGFVIKETENLFKERKTLKKTIYLGLGNEPRYKDGWNKFQKLLKREKPKGFDYEFQDFPKENHASVVLRVYYWGLRKIFKGWIPGKAATLAALETHYQRLTKKFGYPIYVPEPMMNQVGYQLLRGGKIEDAILVFRKNVRHYPDSSNVYDSLGDAYEKSGARKKARENYQKAYDLATKKGETRQAAIYKTNLERVSRK